MAGSISLIFRILIGGIFLLAGLAKISDPVRFLLTLREFQLFPEISLRFLAVYLPWLEFVLGLSILLGVMYRTSALMLAVLNTLFISAIGSVILRGIEVDCGCFGLFADILKLPDMADWKAIVRNLLFTGMCLGIFIIKKTGISLEGYIRSNEV